MSKFKIGDIVNVIYDFDKVVKSKVIDFNTLTNQYMIEVLENKDGFLKEKIYGVYELDLKPIYQENTIDLNKSKQVLQTKPNNDFIYFKDLNIVVPKKIFQEDVLNIRLAQFEKDNNVINGFGVFLYSKKMLIKGFETKEQAQEFLEQLAEVLGSDIL